MVTREEKHSTRGRARLLFEMVHGMTDDADPLQDGWRSDAVREALDLCLACKGCKGDCPVRVDMATYKAEFMHRYYQGRLRPRAAYSMGLIYWWSRAASKLPKLTNFVLQTPGLSHLAKWMGGISQKRQMPRYATQTFRDWFAQRPDRRQEGPEVLLWPDTFNNYFHPHVLQAAVKVLEAAGWQVLIPDRPLCCGRPLYAEGMLKSAKGLLIQLMDHLGDQLRREIPVVGLEPACVATFRDELINLFPADERANYLFQNTFMLDEFLKRQNYQPPKLARRALVHAHCNHHAIMGFEAETVLLDQLGLDYKHLNSGCCGMAGSFGFEADKYPVSIAIGERVLLPAVRQADPATLIITDGFSCREQIRQGTGRQALHLAQVLELALTQAGSMEQINPQEKAHASQAAS
jgi:Fe-S oxidoreductase